MLIFCFIYYNLFTPIYSASEIIIPFAIHPFDICSQNLELWNFIKSVFIISFFISNIIISHFIFVRFFKDFLVKKFSIKKKTKITYKSDLNLLVGKDKDENNIVIP